MNVFWKEVESSACLLVTYLPPIFLAIVPFKDKLRFSKKITCFLIAALCIIELFLFRLNMHYSVSNRVLLPISIFLCSVFALTAIKAHPGKIMFTLLILANMTNCVTVLSKWFESKIFGVEIASQTLNYTNAISTLIVAAIILLPIYIYFNRVYRNGIMKNVNNTPWKYLWVIPTTFYITWIHHMEDSGVALTDIAFETEHALFFFLLNAGSFFAYHTVICMIEMQSKNLELERSNNSLTIQTLQHENLKERIAEARRAKHDIRHHIIFLDSCLQNGEHEKAKEYLKNYKKSLPDDSVISFCEHKVINSMLLYYAQLSKNNGVDFDVVVMDVSESINLPEDVFSVILGNLLENALDACCEQEDGDRVISIRSKSDKHSFFLCIENTYNGKTIRNKKGVLLTSKVKGSGLGLESIQKAVERYNGVLEVKEENKRFCVNVFLNIPEE